MSKNNGYSQPLRAPHDYDAERAVLGCLLLDNSMFPEVNTRLSVDDFYHIPHQIIYRAMLGLIEKKKPIELTLLFDELKRRRHLEESGGPLYIAGLEQFVMATGGAPALADMVNAKATQRRQLLMAETIQQRIVAGDDPEEIFAFIKEQTRLIEGSASRSLPESWKPLPLSEYGKPIKYAPWAIEQLFTQGKVTMIYGQPGVGKTLQVMWAMLLAASGFSWVRPDAGRLFKGQPGLWINRDTSPDELLERRQAMCRGFGIPDEIPMWIVPYPDDGNLMAAATTRYLDSLIREYEARVVVIDCLREFTPADVEENSAAMGKAFTPLKALAAETYKSKDGKEEWKVSFVVIHHEQKETAKGSSGQYRGSTAIAGACDSIIRMSREESDDAKDVRIMIQPKKQRGNPINERTLAFKFTHKGDGRTLDTAVFEKVEKHESSNRDLRTVFNTIRSLPDSTQNVIINQLTGTVSKAKVIDAIRELAGKLYVTRHSGDNRSLILNVTPNGLSFFGMDHSGVPKCSEVFRSTGAQGDGDGVPVFRPVRGDTNGTPPSGLSGPDDFVSSSHYAGTPGTTIDDWTDDQ